jgi:redox-sensitive bicupin YhaK (pirin superfamily)
MALPDDLQEIDPAFVHYPGTELPVVTRDGVTTTVIIGAAQGARSPVAVHSHTLYLEQELQAGASSALPDLAAERAVYVVAGAVTVDGTPLPRGTMAVLRPGDRTLRATEPSRLVVVGGEPAGPRLIWWNFVHSSGERIDRAKQEWARGDFAPVPEDDEFIPLPAR